MARGLRFRVCIFVSQVASVINDCVFGVLQTIRIMAMGVASRPHGTGEQVIF